MISYVKFYELLPYEQRFWPFSRIWEIWSMEELVHFKGGSALWEHLKYGEENLFRIVEFGKKWVWVLLRYIDYIKSMKEWSNIGLKGGVM